MPDMIEEKICQILASNSLNDSDEFCDFTLLQQNEDIGELFILFWLEYYLIGVYKM